MGGHFSIFKGPRYDNREQSKRGLTNWTKRYSSEKNIREYQNERASVTTEAYDKNKSFRRTLAKLQKASGNLEELQALYKQHFGYQWKRADGKILELNETPGIGCVLQLWKAETKTTKGKFEDWFKIGISKTAGAGLCLIALRRFYPGNIITFVIGKLLFAANKPGTAWPNPEDNPNIPVWEDVNRNINYTTTVRDHKGFAKFVVTGLPEADPTAGTMEGKGVTSDLFLGAQFINDAVLTHTLGEWDNEKYKSAMRDLYTNNSAKEMDGTVRAVKRIDPQQEIKVAYFPPHTGWFKTPDRYLPDYYYWEGLSWNNEKLDKKDDVPAKKPVSNRLLGNSKRKAIEFALPRALQPKQKQKQAKSTRKPAAKKRSSKRVQQDQLAADEDDLHQRLAIGM